jgi:uncharacterized Zn-finger protein
VSYLQDGCPKFRNDGGIAEIHVPVRQFKCIGASPPHDHPHIYLDMGEHDTIVCPHCQTRFQFDSLIGEHDVTLYATELESWSELSTSSLLQSHRFVLDRV